MIFLQLFILCVFIFTISTELVQKDDWIHRELVTPNRWEPQNTTKIVGFNFNSTVVKGPFYIKERLLTVDEIKNLTVKRVGREFDYQDKKKLLNTIVDQQNIILELNSTVSFFFVEIKL